jgi:hypothetical protein
LADNRIQDLSIVKVALKFDNSVKVMRELKVYIIYLCRYRLLVGKPERKRPLGRPRGRWVDNIRIDLGEVGWGDVDWIGLVQDRNRWRAVVNAALNLRVP